MSKDSRTTEPIATFARVFSGYAFKSKEFREEGVPVIKIRNIRLGAVDCSDTQCVSEKFLSIDSRYHVNGDDILISLTGSHINQPSSVVGRVARYPRGQRTALLNQRVGKVIVKDTGRCEASFLYYHLFDEQMRRDIAALAHGAANQANVSPSQIESLEVRLPDILTQRKIASILTAYDNLIENNLQRIKILEEMAQNLYREWFVKFRFPGHEKVRFVDSLLGKIPEGWEVRTVNDTFEIMGGGTPSKKVPEYWDFGTINWYVPSDLTSSGMMFMDKSGSKITELGLRKSSTRLFPPMSVMMTSRATLGVISINTTEACTNQGFIICIPNSRYPLHILYQWLHENVETFINLGTGATFKEITKGVFKTIKLIVPPEDIVDKFEGLAGLIGEQILNMERKNITLRHTRDLLLPRLISGELDVSELDIETGIEDVRHEV